MGPLFRFASLRAGLVVALAVGVPSASASSRPATTFVPPALADAVARMRPAVVNVSTRSVVRPERRGGGASDSDEKEHASTPLDQLLERFFGASGGRAELRRSLGSGLIVDPAGYILTNNHVIGDAIDITVTLSDERSFPARVVGRDARTDLALLKIDSPDLPAATLGDSDAIRVGDLVVAVGNPFGLNQTVTSGIVSAKGRVIGAGPYDDFIQTDASINPGNSGGPLYNLSGEVVGLNTAIVESARGIGFAIPANLLKSLLPQLRDHGKVTRGFLGLAVQHVTPTLSRALGVRAGRGALVAEVDAGGPAAAAGLRAGDTILALDGAEVPSSDRLPEMVAQAPPGAHLRVDLVRDGRWLQLSATVGELRDPDAARASALPTPAGTRSPKGLLGLEIRPLSPEEARKLERPGVVVAEVDPSGPASGALEAGDVILEVDRHPVAAVDQVRRALESRRAGSVVLFRIHREDSRLYVAVERPR